jgi:1-deoxy-D-xylulose-5-phosphate reductoisomerase
MVTYTDGATIAQLSQPDMRLPIGYALAYPDRITTAFGAIDWAQVGTLEFEPPDLEAFGCLALAYAAGRAGGTAPAWLNAANEEAVAAFLDGRLRWIQIAPLLADVLDLHDGTPAADVHTVVDVDHRARATTRRAIERISL